MKKNDKIMLGDNEYILCEDLGSGGNGTVWSAKIDNEEPIYAVKFLKFASDSKKFERFQREISFCAHHDHPNIIKVFAQGFCNDTPCYLMPKYEKTLKNVIESESDYIQIIDYILQICEGIKYIHSLPEAVIHRDIKTENILIDNNGKIAITDFGIAHFIDSALTSNNDLLCNRNYFAPEQIKGNALNVTTACDVYTYKLKTELPAETIEEIDLIDHIYVDWSNTIYDESVENKLNKDIDDVEIQKIIQLFTSDWDVLITQTDAEHYSVKFKTKRQYNEFKRYALALSKPYYIFEGDVIDSLKIHREYDDFVELVSWTDFEIKNMLAKILKLRTDY